MFKSLQTKIMFFAGILLFAFSGSALSQTTIGATEILNLVGATQTVELDTASGLKAVDVGNPGGPQSWDFDSIALNDPFELNSEFVQPAGTPYEQDFPESNAVQKLTGQTENPLGPGQIPIEIYNYFEVSATGLRTVGTGVRVIIGFPVTVFTTTSNSTPVPLPLTFNSTWTAMDTDTTVDGLTGGSTVENSSSTSIVDAWGTALAAGLDLECLRICNFDTTVIQEYDADGNELGPSDTTTTIEYTWVSPTNGFVAILTSQDGETNANFNEAKEVFRLKSGISTSIGEHPNDAILPTTFDLSQNYPNPFNPETKIRFSVGKAGHVEVAVFDLQGRLVKTLIDQDMPVGQHAVSWDGTDMLDQKVASGRFIYRLNANGEAKSKIMVLVK